MVMAVYFDPTASTHGSKIREVIGAANIKASGLGHVYDMITAALKPLAGPVAKPPATPIFYALLSMFSRYGVAAQGTTTIPEAMINGVPTHFLRWIQDMNTLDA
jgi:hypothetical protein